MLTIAAVFLEKVYSYSLVGELVHRKEMSTNPPDDTRRKIVVCSLFFFL